METRHGYPADGSRTRLVGVTGERLAAEFLRRRGVRMIARNVVVDRGELDLVGEVRGNRVAFEVRTRVGDDPLDSFDLTKLDRVRRAARHHDPPIWRIDLLTVRLNRDSVDIRWMPDL
jgi:putative endonuclease